MHVELNIINGFIIWNYIMTESSFIYHNSQPAVDIKEYINVILHTKSIYSENRFYMLCAK